MQKQTWLILHMSVLEKAGREIENNNFSNWCFNLYQLLVKAGEYIVKVLSGSA